jgi:hypothetical protein
MESLLTSLAKYVFVSKLFLLWHKEKPMNNDDGDDSFRRRDFACFFVLFLLTSLQDPVLDECKRFDPHRFVEDFVIFAFTSHDRLVRCGNRRGK